MKKDKYLRAFLIFSALSFCVCLRADEVADLQELLNAGEYKSVISRGDDLLNDSKLSSKFGMINQIIGEAKYYARGERKNALANFEEAKKRGVAEASLFLGRLAMNNYDFAAAQKHYTDYRNLKKRSKKPVSEELEAEESYVKEGKTLFERVRELVVIDAINVNKKELLNNLRLPLSAGRIVDIKEIPVNTDGRETGNLGYISESGEMMMWSEQDPETEMMQIMEAYKLADGTVSDHHPSSEALGLEGDAINPFLTADGTTLYYASNGEGTIGGYDIFMATRDPQTGEYMQPVNAGLPFNSYSDDYFLAIDEENGVGWWATDRHFLPNDNITLYVFILPEERKNLNCNDEEKRERSILDNIRVTWEEPQNLEEDEEDDEEIAQETDAKPDKEELVASYIAKADEIRKIQPGQKPQKRDFKIPLKGGKFLYSLDDVAGTEQRMMIEQYIRQEKTYNKDVEELDKLRKEYSKSSNPSVGQKIRTLESAVQKEKLGLDHILSQFYRSIGYK